MSSDLDFYGVRMTDVELSIFSAVDEEVEKAIVSGSPLSLFEYGNQLRRSQSVHGLALAKLLHRIKSHWDTFMSAGMNDDAQSVVCSEMGIPSETFNKYVRMWESIFENANIDDEIKKLLMGKPIGHLLLLTASAREGSLGAEEMKSAALASSKSELQDIIKGARGEQTSSKNAIRILYYPNDTANYPAGTVVAKQGDNYDVLGPLKGKTDFGRSAVARLINSAGAIERFE